MESELATTLAKIDPECGSYLQRIADYVLGEMLKATVKAGLEYVDPEKRTSFANAIGDAAVDVGAQLGNIFTASATRGIFGWGRNFNLNKRVISYEPYATLLEQASTRMSPLAKFPKDPLYYTWPDFPGPFASLADPNPKVPVPLALLKELAAQAAVPKSDPAYPDGYLTNAQWQSWMSIDPGLYALMHTKRPVHIGYEFPLGPKSAVHHGIYFGRGSADEPLEDGGLVIEVMNKIVKTGGEESVKSFIAPSTLLSFLRRTATNNLNGLLVYAYTNDIPLDIAMQRAVWAMGGFDYNVIKKNCENFVSWTLMNTDSNTTCVRFRSAARTYVKSALGLGGKKRT